MMPDLDIFKTDRAFARSLDTADPLASFRDEFIIDDPDLIYADGNSLGRLPKRTVECMRTAVDSQWGHDLIRGWNRGWYDAPSRIGDKIGRLIGASPGQTVVSDSTCVNLYKLNMAALAMHPGRSKIVTDNLNFPSDLYIMQGCIAQSGSRHRLHTVPSVDGVGIDLQNVYEAIDDDTALVSLSHVAYKSAFLYDAQSVTEKAHKAGALVLWDLSHSVGVVPAELDAWGVDLAVGCTYKYLNGGPGAPAFLYVRRELQDQALSPIWGWFGQKSPFAFGLDYAPIKGVKRFLVGTPPILSLLAMESAVDIVLEAGIDRIRDKSVQLTEYLIYLFDENLVPLKFSLGSPREAHQRGSHVSIRHDEGYRINRALIEEMQVIPDFREPDIIRLGLSPLYTSYTDVWEMVERIRAVVERKLYLNYPHDRPPVT
jgi:kynureninase